jgi:hypothetical protein
MSSVVTRQVSVERSATTLDGNHKVCDLGFESTTEGSRTQIFQWLNACNQLPSVIIFSRILPSGLLRGGSVATLIRSSKSSPIRQVTLPQTNGICERFHKTIQQEFYQVTFTTKLYADM